uniref:Uncharacterized protein n=1 Tax=Callorhinchus milii TaxID=7868 RepID=A0A4W3I9I6_CALMI
MKHSFSDWSLQLLQGKSIPKYETWHSAEKGSGEMDDSDVQISGDCDDEDGCLGSGNGEEKKSSKASERMLDKTNRHDFTVDDVNTTPKTVHGRDSDETDAGTMVSSECVTITISIVALILFW